MKKRASLLIAICVIAMMLFASTSVFAAAPFEGSGTESDPYLIQNYEDLCKLSELVNNEGHIPTEYNDAYYRQTADIIANEGTFSLRSDFEPRYNNEKIVWEYDENDFIIGAEGLSVWYPIQAFYGHFDGNGYEITGLYICSNDYFNIGLFAYTEKATLTNITIDNSVFHQTETEAPCGGIVAHAYSSTIENCTNSAFILAPYKAGGICGEAEFSSITECINNQTVRTDSNESDTSMRTATGGIVGEASRSTISSCVNNANIYGFNCAGGIVGQRGYTEFCENYGSVTGNRYIGGICGTDHSDSTSTASFNQGKISGNAYIGGIYGRCGGDILQCINLGDININTAPTPGPIELFYNGCGGICGYLMTNGDILGCGNKGTVNGNTVQHTGGICGLSSGIIGQSMNLGKVVSNGTAGGILGKALDTALVAYCINTGEISSNGFAGGILGDLFTGWFSYFSRDFYDENYVFSCYNVGNVKSSSGYAGGVAGSQINYTVDNCYYLNTTASKAIATDLDSTAITKAMTASEMKQKSFVPALNAGENIFKYDDLNENDGYPMLLALSQMPFSDVAADAYYFDPVLWAVENGITNGMGDGTFGSDRSCTRGQFVTFLWRAAGCPEATDTTCAFTDCDPNAYYYPAVLWAVENGVTNGTSATTFSPDKTVNRAEVITFLWKYDGKPTISGSEPFTDVNENDWFYDAVKWGYANGLAKGMTDTTYGSMGNCTRAQTVTFLYRYFAE